MRPVGPSVTTFFPTVNLGKRSLVIILQVIPALTDFKGPTLFIFYMRISVLANIEIKEKLFQGTEEKFLL